MKKVFAVVGAVICAIICAIFMILCIERVSVGNVGVVYSANGVEEETLSQGWHFLSPFKSVKQFPISQQQIVLSNDQGAYQGPRVEGWRAQ